MQKEAERRAAEEAERNDDTVIGLPDVEWETAK
jgi:hypothetical protein